MRSDSNGRVQELLAELQEKNALIERMQEVYLCIFIILGGK